MKRPVKGPVKRSKLAKPPQPLTSGCAPMHPALRDYLGYCLVKAALRIKMKFEQNFKDLEVAPPHFAILTILNAQGPLNQLSLGEQLAIDKATMVKLIDTLERLKLVERSTCAEDRRAKYVNLTEAGRKTWRKLHTKAQQTEREFFAALTKSEIEQLKKSISKILGLETT